VIKTNETIFLTKIPVVKRRAIVYNHVTEVLIVCQDLRWWAISKNWRVFNFAIFINSRKSRKFHAREIYMVYSKLYRKRVKCLCYQLT